MRLSFAIYLTIYPFGNDGTFFGILGSEWAKHGNSPLKGNPLFWSKYVKLFFDIFQKSFKVILLNLADPSPFRQMSTRAVDFSEQSLFRCGWFVKSIRTCHSSCTLLWVDLRSQLAAPDGAYRWSLVHPCTLLWVDLSSQLAAPEGPTNGVVSILVPCYGWI